MTVAREFLRAQPNTRINTALVDVPGSNLNCDVGSSAIMGEALTASWAACARDLFLGTAEGSGLDRYVFDRFGMTRKSAAPASVALTLARPTFAAGGGVVNASARVTSPGGSIFALQTDVTFGATDLTQPAVGIAQIVGPTQNIPDGSLTAWIDQPFDATITVTNPVAAAGGTDTESDSALRARAAVYFLTIRRGVLAAIQFGATTVPGVSVSTAFEILNPGTGFPAAAVELIIADDNGRASPTMIQGVIDVLLQYRAAGIPVFVSGGNVVFEPVVFHLSFASGIDTVAATAQVRAVASAFSQFLRPGQTLLRSDMLAAARAVPGTIVGADALPVPVGDIVPVSNSTIIRVRPQDVSFV
jgi:uncharacterized phage protein gp47/JayE